MIVENVINDTIQITKYISNYEKIINDYINNINTNYYCGSTMNESLIYIENLYKILSIQYIDNIYNITIDITDLNINSLPFEKKELLLIYDTEKYIKLPDNMLISTIYNIYYNIPIAIGKIININFNNNNLILQVENINNDVNNINIGNYVCVNKPNDEILIFD
jgi:hypothetical protein